MPNILIIDDDATTCFAVQEALQSAGYRTEAASDGSTGVRLAHDHHPDLILCDIDMPGMNGYETQKALATDPETKTLPFIFLTGSTKAIEGQFGRELSGDEFIEKPFSFSKLLAVVGSRLGR